MNEQLDIDNPDEGLNKAVETSKDIVDGYQQTPIKEFGETKDSNNLTSGVSEELLRQYSNDKNTDEPVDDSPVPPVTTPPPTTIQPSEGITLPPQNTEYTQTLVGPEMPTTITLPQPEQNQSQAGRF